MASANECAGFEGDCEVCAQYHGRALKVQELWQERARRLNIPLSAKGQTVGQRGVFTGVAIDMYRGRFNMLPEKLWSMVAARDKLATAKVSTQLRVSCVRGKATGTTQPHVSGPAQLEPI